MEFEADRLALALLAVAGFNPEALIEVNIPETKAPGVRC